MRVAYKLLQFLMGDFLRLNLPLFDVVFERKLYYRTLYFFPENSEIPATPWTKENCQTMKILFCV